MEDISVFGSRVQVVASSTFPAGFTLTQFADDGDPFDMPSVQIKDKAMGVNGDLIIWSKANPLMLTISLIPNSEDDKNAQVLWDANRVGKGKQSARDVVDITVVYADGSTLSLTEGTITDGPAGNAGASSGRLKTKAYQFAFENVNRT